MSQLRSPAAPSTSLQREDPGVGFLLSLVGGRPRVPPGIDWNDAVDLLRSHGLEGLAVAAHRERELLPPEVVASLEPAYRVTGLHSTLSLEAARRARGALAGAGIAALLYKGAALLEDGTYADPGARRMDDADLLIPPGRADGAVRCLREAGFETWSPWEPARVRWLDSVTLTDVEAPPGVREVSVDLHWRVRYGSVRFGEARGLELLWEGADAERGLPAPGPHLLVVMEHFLKHLRILVHFPGLADLVRICRRTEDWSWVLERARRHPSARAYGVVFEFLHRELGASVPDAALELGGGPWSRRLSRRALEPRRLVRAGAPAGGRIRGLLFRWLLRGSSLDAAGEVVRTALPGPGWLRARYGSPEASLARLYLRYWREVIGWAAGRGPSPVSPNQELLG